MRLVETEHLTRKFGDVTAVDGLTFTIAEGEVFRLPGPNGAGKTTTVRPTARSCSARASRPSPTFRRDEILARWT